MWSWVEGGGQEDQTHVSTTARDCHHSGRGISQRVDFLGEVEAEKDYLIRGLFLFSRLKRLED